MGNIYYILYNFVLSLLQINKCVWRARIGGEDSFHFDDFNANSNDHHVATLDVMKGNKVKMFRWIPGNKIKKEA